MISSIVSSLIGGKIGSKLGRQISRIVYTRKFSRTVFKHVPDNIDQGIKIKPGLWDLILYLLGLVIIVSLTGIFLIGIYFLIIFSFKQEVLQYHNWGTYVFRLILGLIFLYFGVFFTKGFIQALKYLIFLPQVKIYKNGLVITTLLFRTSFVPWRDLISVRFNEETKIFDVKHKSFLIEIIYRASGVNTVDKKSRNVSKVLLYEFTSNMMWLLGAIAYFKPELEEAVANILKSYHISKPSEARKIINIVKRLEGIFDKLPEYKGV